MRFPVDLDHLYHPRPIGLLAMRLRLWLLGNYEETTAARDMSAMRDRPSGLRLRSADVRRALGIGSANDARRLRAAVAELHGDPMFIWIAMEDGGRAVAFEVCGSIHRAEYMERYVSLDLQIVLAPGNLADLHLALRHAVARRMRAPAVQAPPHEVAAIAGPGRKADRAWARRTLLPAAVRLAARLDAPVFVAATWSDERMAPTLRMRFGGPDTVWTEEGLGKVTLFEWAWRVTPAGAALLRRPAAEPIAPGTPAGADRAARWQTRAEAHLFGLLDPGKTPFQTASGDHLRLITLSGDQRSPATASSPDHPTT